MLVPQQVVAGATFDPLDTTSKVLVVHLVQLARTGAAERVKAIEELRAAVAKPEVLVAALSADSALDLREFAKAAGCGLTLLAVSETDFDVWRGLDPQPVDDTYVIGPSGHIVWRGPAADVSPRQVEAMVQGASLLPKVGPVLSPARAKAEKGHRGAALADVEKLLAKANLKENDRADAERLQAWLLRAHAIEMRHVTALLEGGRTTLALERAKRARDLMRGSEPAAAAKEVVERLSGQGAEITRQREADAAYTRAEAKALALVRTAGDASGAVPELEAVAHKYGNEKVGALATALVERIRARRAAAEPAK